MSTKLKVSINVSTLILAAGIIFGILYSSNISSSVQTLDIKVEEQKVDMNQSIIEIHKKLDRLIQMELDEKNKAN